MRQDGSRHRLVEFLLLLTLLGGYLTLRGYRSFEGDQAYRFPMLLASWNPGLYGSDPFVASFGAFNPHRGALGVIGFLARGLGLSATLALLFALTFLLTMHGVRRMAAAAWPGERGAGLAAALLFLATLAGNIGTNHLFEPIVLDRQMALALIWFGLGRLLVDPTRGAVAMALALSVAAVIHPTFGLQAGMIVSASLVAWRLLGWEGATDRMSTPRSTVLQGLAILPGLALNLQGSQTLMDGLPVATFRQLSLELQGPQHMLPHLWRLPQWLAWGCFPLLAALAMAARATRPDKSAPPDTRVRLLVLVGVTLTWLGASWVGVEILGHLRLTLFQPFRMATLARGLCLLLVAGHVAALWQRGGSLPRARAVLLLVGVTGDWSLVVVTTFEVAMTLGELLQPVCQTRPFCNWVRLVSGPIVLAWGLVFLGRHDTESGHWPILAAIAATLLGERLFRNWQPRLSLGRRLRIASACWVVPVSALIAGLSPVSEGTTGQLVRDWLVKHCRFVETPLDDVERLAVWCRTNTPRDALFVGPPGPKTFRLWSRRSLAFNRAGSPYNARGLGDWANRFAAHVGFPADADALIRAYHADRHGLERRYDRLSPAALAGLAARQGADFLILRDRSESDRSALEVQGLERVKVEGRYALYRASANDRLARRNDSDHER